MSARPAAARAAVGWCGSGHARILRPMSAARASLFAAALSIGTAVPTQEPAPAEPVPAAGAQDLPGLIERVRAAHRGEHRDVLDRFRAALRVKSVVPDQDSVELDIAATFLAPRYLRYRVEEPGKVLERGWDDRGAWSRVGDEVQSIAGKERELEREGVRQQVGLARQLLGFLDPATLLGGLTEAALVEREELPVGRRETRTCEVVRGVAAGFPLFQPPAEGPAEPRCGLKIYVDAASGRLVGLVATPLDAEGRPQAAPEFVLLRDYAEQQGIAVPTGLLVYRGAPGAGAPLASVTVRAIDLAPDGISKETMRRPAG